ncbi:MAG: 4-(cytidine 5'-diphospho)-2-C-methyl-D-erythritol kinase [Erythrobacter sp.]|uniref:4-(cytidine 5'-diphospho)-2-C-methyl-D-erythritol kinase n=1 Tax=Erythrobacter sp. TaxID=1042 RepID=UPI0026204556|nr:4-(cytidine 5'-diphospho)-2-C-methyl-D-erythritol kinase [Erythrobacter sp.]MDJ0977868.1 4-(cytidine 5'-diphospho)-2-C-methyl-D-erythritol kinase [Erythrobacter sp.]
MQQTAYAKINLALHVRERRDDGYHELETLFAFVDAGDTLTARVAEQDSLHVVGEFSRLLTSPLPSLGGGAGGGGSQLSTDEHPDLDPPPQGGGGVFDNLVARALATLPRPQGLAVTLEKNLPVAAGLGGGSADAGAVFRMVEELHGLPDDWQTRAAKLGADVPSCVRSEMAIGYGTGTKLVPVDNDLTGTPVLLVNPRVPLSTGAVFKAWDTKDRGPLPKGSARTITLEGRNDLHAPALAQCAVIGDVLAALNATEAWIVRMSGSGATCFALFETEVQRDAAQAHIATDRPQWWMLGGKLR